MGFLDDLLKDVEKGIDRVQQGADKLLSENALRTEIEKLTRDQKALLAEIGEEAVALYAAGEIALPGMAMQIAQLRDVREKIELKQAELVQVAQAKETAAAPDAGRPAAAAFCATCGARLSGGAAFCPECGTKVS